MILIWLLARHPAPTGATAAATVVGDMRRWGAQKLATKHGHLKVLEIGTIPIKDFNRVGISVPK